MDSAGVQATIAWNNPCLTAGNMAVLRVQSGNKAALTAVADDRERRATSTGGFFLCATSLSIQQGQQTFAAGSFRLFNSNGNEVCQEVPPGTTINVQVQVAATSTLNLNAPFTVIYNGQKVTEFQSSGPPSAAVLAVAPNPVIFDVIPVGNTQDKTFTITNTGSAVLTGGLTLIASGSGTGVFTLLSGDTVNVAPGQSQEVKVRYSAFSNDVLIGSVRLTTNGGVATVVLQGKGQQPPQLFVAPTSVDFGSVPAQEIANAAFTVANIGSGVLTGSVSTTAPFSIVSSGSFSLGTGQNQVVTVRYSPVGVGVNNGSVAVSSNGGSATVTLIGTQDVGVDQRPPQLSVSPLTLDYGTFSAASGSKTITFTVANVGGGTLTGGVVSGISPALPGFSLSAGQSQSFSAYYPPGSATPGQSFPPIVIDSNGGSATITVTGTVVP